MFFETLKKQQEWIKHLLPLELQGLLKLISITSGVLRLLKFLNWLKDRIVAWCQTHPLKQEETLTEQSRSCRRFDPTYIEGLIREGEDEIDELKKQGYTEAEILRHTLVRVFGICFAVVQMAWDSMFIKRKPKS